MSGGPEGRDGSVRQRRRIVVWAGAAAFGVLAAVLISSFVTETSLPEGGSEPLAAETEGRRAKCDPAITNRTNPADGGIGPDCKYYPPIVMPPKAFPDTLFAAAHDYYVGRLRDVDPIVGREKVMLVVLRLSPEEMEANRRYAVERRWNRRFLADLEDAIRWGESLRNADPQHVYDLAKSFRAAGPTGSAPDFAYWLHSLAIKRDLPEAIFDDAVARLDDPDRINRVTAWHALRRMAMRGYSPALNEIVTRLREGRAYPPDDAELFFWLLRSEQVGLPVAEEIRKVQPRLTDDRQAWVRQWLERNEWPTEFGE
jgi:hypothetical protein